MSSFMEARRYLETLQQIKVKRQQKSLGEKEETFKDLFILYYYCTQYTVISTAAGTIGCFLAEEIREELLYFVKYLFKLR